jgi:N-acetylneuraminate synthase
MKTDFEFRDLFVLDLANNHQGDLEHGLRVVREIGQVVRARGVRAALKFQFRQLDTFIHPEHQANSPNKHIPRFLATRLSQEQFATLAREVRANGMLTMATPFDEGSVDQALELGVEIIKVASCSAADWPLLEKIADCNRPVIFSTGGLTWKQIDDLVSFFDHRRVHFAIMHCVSIYPTPDEDMQLNQIGLLRQRYPEKVIGFSTHEAPDALAPVCAAVAKGAQILERHVGVATEAIKLNTYSSTPEQLDRWIGAALQAQKLCGSPERGPAPPAESEALRSLFRGVYARGPLRKGQVLAREDVYFAMPCGADQLTSGQWAEGVALLDDVGKDQPLAQESVKLREPTDRQVLFTTIHTVKAMLNEARIALSPTFETEFSHHYGLARFPEVGATFITCVNRAYCKKLIIQLPGQHHPAHYHKTKEETFMVLHGILEMVIEGRRRTLYPGDTQLVQQGVWHQFWTDTGVIFEEISTADCPNDSFYEDKDINHMPRAARKTRVNQWGRYQL